MIAQTEQQLKEKTNEELLEMYRVEKSLEVKQELTLRYLYIVQTIAVQMRGVYAGSLQMEDIINEGVIAIMKGIDRYEPDREHKFETFISQRIRGMIIDLVRKNDWMPRNFRKQNKEIEDARNKLGLSLGRTPSDEEIADYLGLSIKKCQKIQRMSVMMNVLSLDMVVDSEDDRQSIQPPNTDMDREPEKAFLKDEAYKLLTMAVDRLNEKEKLMISLYYVEELNMKQIAHVMNVSEPRVSQIHSNAIRKLKLYMSEYE
ncbi:MAG: FliA/WhiG family RNA polymerase sigma factor [Clostridium sp.]|nr:FliA/WhiG family RNA polymerase sigma factor [Clostridium sp.]